MSFSFVGLHFWQRTFFSAHMGHFLTESHHYWKLVNVWVWSESQICTGWLQGHLCEVWGVKGICHVCVSSRLCVQWPVSRQCSFYLLCLGFMVMLSCSANHLYVCHQCISGIIGLFVCAIISISVPARQTHSCFYSSSTRSYTVYCSLVALSLSGLLLQGHTESVFFTLTAVSSCPWYLICVFSIWIPPISGKNCYVFYRIGKWIFIFFLGGGGVDHYSTIDHSLWRFKSSMLMCDHSARMPWTVTLHCDSCVVYRVM